MDSGAVGHPSQILLNLVKRFQRRRFKCESLRHMTDVRLTRHQVMAKAHLAKAQKHTIGPITKTLMMDAK